MTDKDSHFFLPKVKTTLKDIENEDVYPFKKAIENGCDAIMVGHLVISELDTKNPASLSKKVISGFLRKNCNFNKLIITDDMKMLAIRLLYRPKISAFKAIQAGNDMIMIGPSEQDVNKIIKYVKKQVEKEKIKESDIDESISRIVEIKLKYNINDKHVNGVDINKINEEIDELNEYVNDYNNGKIEVGGTV